jgi:GNAT superfamily N-acetyltransferase
VHDASLEDWDEFLRMGYEFYLQSGYQDMGEFNPNLLREVFEKLVEAKTLIMSDGGMIGWINFPVFMTGTMIAQELFWWVDEDKRKGGTGLKLLKKAEKQAKEQGAQHILMLCLDRLDGEKVAKLYKAMGYESREQTFMRAL